jgi:phosphoglycerate dehydrogenase-like enzyme
MLPGNLIGVFDGARIGGGSCMAQLFLASRGLRAYEAEIRPLLEPAAITPVWTAITDRPHRDQDFLSQATGCQGIVVGPEGVSRAAMEGLGELRIIARTGVGVDTVDVEAATRRGIWVTNTPGANHEAVADLTLGFMLALARQIPRHAEIARGGSWARVPMVEMHRKTIGLVGIGRIGRSVARRAAGFDMTILAHDPFADAGWCRANGIALVGLNDLLSRSDVVSLHALHTPATRQMINADSLSRMRPTAFLINTSRGELIDEAALLAALDAGRLAGAALDVLAHEPPAADDPILRHPKVLVTPHIAGTTVESTIRMGLQAIGNAVAVLAGGTPPDAVNRPAGR